MRKKALAGLLLLSMTASSFSNLGYVPVNAAEYEDTLSITTKAILSEENEENFDAETTTEDELITEETITESSTEEVLSDLSDEGFVSDTINTETNETNAECVKSGRNIVESAEYDTWSWSLDEDGFLLVEGEIKDVDIWFWDSTKIKSAKIMGSATGSLSNMFNECRNLTTLDLSNFSTDNVTSMSSMFYNCCSLTSLDLSNFNTDNVINMNGMFTGCSNLTSLDLSNFNTSKVTDMSSMFYECSNLTTLDLSKLNTDNVTSMNSMFYNCCSLTSLDLSNFNTSKVTDMSSMFYECSNLTTLDLSKLNTDNVTSMSSMFNSCSSLTSLDLSNFNTENVINISYMFAECSSLSSLDLSSFDTKKVTGMMSLFDGCSSLTSLDLSYFNTEQVTNMSYMFRNCSGLTSLDLTSFNTGNVLYIYNMFSGCSELTSLDLSTFNTDKVSDMSFMFYGCGLLTSLDLSSFNTTNVTEMKFMFSECSNLTNLILNSFNTENTTEMESMFSGCSSLTCLDLSSFNLKSLNSADSFLDECISLRQIKSPYNLKKYIVLPIIEGYVWSDESGNDVMTMNRGLSESVIYNCSESENMSNISLSEEYETWKWTFNSKGYLFVEGNIKRPKSGWPWESFKGSVKTVKISGSGIGSMYGLFYGCKNINSIDISKFDTKAVTKMNYMFCECSSLTNLDVSNFNTTNVTDMNWMFGECSSLTSLNLNNFNTGKVTNMSCMFNECSSLTDLDVSNFNTTNVTDMNAIFGSCSNLTSLDLSSFNVSNIIYTDNLYNILFNCNSLNEIKSPYNIKQLIQLCDDTWLDQNGTNVKYMHTNRSYSITYKKVKDCKIFFAGNGATSGDTPYITSDYNSLNLPNNGFIRIGYTFNGWNTEKDGSGYSFNNETLISDVMSDNLVVLYAQWKPITYKVAFNSNGGTGTMTAMTGRTYSVPFNLTKNTFKRAGYTFLAWNTKKDASGIYVKDKSSVKNLTSVNGKTVTLYAIWKKVTVGQVSTPAVSNPAAGKMLVAYKPVTGAQGYMVQYSTSSNMRNSKTVVLTANKKVIPGVIKGKTYYVRVVAFKMDSTGKKVFGKFSPIQNKRIFR